VDRRRPDLLPPAEPFVGTWAYALLEGVYAANPGTYLILVDVVSDPPSSIPPDPKHREIAPGELLAVSVP
jgi:hypothetical protein